MNALKTLSLLTLLALLANCSCSKNSTEPPAANGPDTTSHNYEWQVDTLKAPDALQVLMRGVWGTNGNNVWVVGHSDELKYQLWHWDGSGWENIRLWFPGHPYSMREIHGFSEDDVWIIGIDSQDYPNTRHRSFIIHYNGNNWDLIEEIDAPFCLSIWGSSSSNLFVGTDSGMVLHFDGSAWDIQQTGTHAQMISIQGDDSKVYAIGSELDTSPYDSTTYYFFEYVNGNWQIREQYIRYPFSPPPLFGKKLWLSPEGTLYSVGEGLFILQDNAWVKMRDETLFAIHGMAWNNIFVGGWENQLLHYNGNDWFLYEKFRNSSQWISGIWSTDRHVFIIGRAINQTFIYRGTLQP